MGIHQRKRLTYHRVPTCPGQVDRCVIVIIYVSPPFRGDVNEHDRKYDRWGTPITIFRNRVPLAMVGTSSVKGVL